MGKCSDQKTKANNCVVQYTQNVTGQPNINKSYAKYREKWDHNENAVGSNKKTYATSKFTKKEVVTKWKKVTTDDKGNPLLDKYGKKTVKKVAEKTRTDYTFPWTLASADFRLDLPDEAYIRRIAFYVDMRVTDKKAKVTMPIGNFRLLKGGFNNKPVIDEETKGKKTGWHNGSYWVVPKETLSTTFKKYVYSIEEEDIQLAKINASTLNNPINGIDLMFDKAEWDSKDGSCEIQVRYIYIKVEYDLPNYTLTIYNPKYNSHESPKNYAEIFTVDETVKFKIRAYNNTKAKGLGNRRMIIHLPWECELVSVTKNHGSYGTNDGEIKRVVWTIPPFDSSAGEKHMWITLKPKMLGLDRIYAQYFDDEHPQGWDADGNILSGAEYWMNVQGFDIHNSQTIDDGKNIVTISSDGEFCKGTVCCLNIVIRGWSADTSLTVNLSNPSDFGEGNDKTVMTDLFDNLYGENITYSDDLRINGVWTFIEENSSADWRLTAQSQTHAVMTYTGTPSVLVSVPEYQINLQYCFIPWISGDVNFCISNSDEEQPTCATIPIKDIHYEVDTGAGDSRKLVTHRMASEVNIDEAIFVCMSDEIDRNMIMSECRLNASTWEDLDYIGCVPLEHLHFNPKSTYKDTLLNQTYKNKKYMGKKLAPDEDITLNVRLHPQQVTTIQGLIDMDKPIPINANHRCFESDALNHRGWAEIYSIKAEETNPHWYKCDIDVKYLTHNLNTRFKIDKSAKVSDYDSSIPTIMQESWANGTNLSQNQSNSYFITDTDGTFYYLEDYVDTTITDNPVTHHFNNNVRNNFNIDNGQHIRVKTRQALTNISNVEFTWSSVKIAEDRENKVSRIVRLMDKSNKVLFEYQYDEIQFTENEATADIIYRVRQKNDSFIDYNEPSRIQFRYNPNDSVTEDDDVDGLDDDINANESGEAHFGSTVEFNLKNNTLQVVDRGFNGREIVINDIKLVKSQYYLEVEWVNNNDDAETSSIDCTFDFGVQDTIFTSTYADKFSKLVVSPYPIPNKKVVFTREAEEGTIYYYEDDEDEFSFLIEPYYIYHNGCDLVTSDGVSIFNLNYGYKIVYMQNGLVRLGFNRLNGELYLGKYDPQSHDYVTVANMKLEKFDDINLNTISDDKIEVQSSDSVFTIYRGHPYIKIKHELEDIPITSVATHVWAESVGNESTTNLPLYWNLCNNSNLLPSCLADKLDSDCVETESVTHNNRQSTRLDWHDFPSEIPLGTTQYQLECDTLQEYVDEIDLKENTCSFGTYTVEYVSDGTIDRFGELTASKPIIEPTWTTKLMARLLDSAGNGVPNKTVSFYEVFTPFLTLMSNKAIMQSGETAQLSAKLKDIDGSVVQGQTVKFYAFPDGDKGLAGDGNHNDIWTLRSSSSTVLSRESTYSSVTYNTGSTYAYIETPCCDNLILEFDVYVSGSKNNWFFTISSSENECGLALTHLGDNFNLNTWYHMKITIENGASTVECGATTVVLPTIVDNPSNCKFTCNNSITEVRFKNFTMNVKK